MEYWKRQWITAVAWVVPGVALAQAVPPFVGGPVTAFDVQVSVIESGALLDASPVVSQDRRYVTINAQPTNTSLLALQQFRTQTAQSIGSGYVGGVNPSGIDAGSLRANGNSPAAILQAAKNSASVLNHRGVYLLASLK